MPECFAEGNVLVSLIQYDLFQSTTLCESIMMLPDVSLNYSITSNLVYPTTSFILLKLNNHTSQFMYVKDKHDNVRNS